MQTILIRIKADIDEDEISLKEIEDKMYDAMEDIAEAVEFITVKETE